MNINPFLWVSVAIAFLLAEVGHPGLFFFLPFACGAAFSAMVAVWTNSLIIEAVCFLVSSLIAFVVIHFWIKKRAPVEKGNHKTNTDALIGVRARVTKAIEKNDVGYIKFNGQSWMARSIDGARIEVNTPVDIVAVRGAHVVVKEALSPL